MGPKGPPLLTILDDALSLDPWTNIPLSPQQKRSLCRLLEELARWNRTFSFTSLTHPRDLVEVFLLDSLAPLALDLSLSSPLLDAGCGVGFPSLPLKIAQPHLQMVAVDSSRKKVNFIRHMVRLLKLQGYTPRWDRLETLVREGLTFPMVTVRALTGGETTRRLVPPLLAPGGKALLFVGKEWTSHQLPGGLQTGEHLEYLLPFSGKVRGLVLASRVD